MLWVFFCPLHISHQSRYEYFFMVLLEFKSTPIVHNYHFQTSFCVLYCLLMICVMCKDCIMLFNPNWLLMNLDCVYIVFVVLSKFQNYSLWTWCLTPYLSWWSFQFKRAKLQTWRWFNISLKRSSIYESLVFFVHWSYSLINLQWNVKWTSMAFNLGLGLIMWCSFSLNEKVKKKKKWCLWWHM